MEGRGGNCGFDAVGKCGVLPRQGIMEGRGGNGGIYSLCQTIWTTKLYCEGLPSLTGLGAQQVLSLELSFMEYSWSKQEQHATCSTVRQPIHSHPPGCPGDPRSSSKSLRMLNLVLRLGTFGYSTPKPSSSQNERA